MADSGEIKQEPVVPISNVKYEPTGENEEPGQIKITNVRSITPDSVPNKENPEDLNSGVRSTNKIINKFRKKKSVIETTNGIAPEDIASEKMYSFRKRKAITYDETLDQANFTSPCPIRKQKVNPAKFYNRTTSPAKKQDNLTCDICLTVFFSIESLEDHVVEMHVVDKEFNCAECTESFISQDGLNSHMAKHQDEEESNCPHKCPVCFRTFAKRFRLNLHMMTHDVEKPIKCKLCPKSFISDYHLDIHEMKQHGKEKTFKCSKCSKSFARNFFLEDHLRTHSNARNMICENCGATFKTKHSLRNHRPSCKGPSSKNKLLGNGMSEEITGKTQAKRGTAAADHEVKTSNYQYKQYRCHVCVKVCTTFASLKEHKITHTCERNFKCNLCHKTYKRKPDLKTHIKRKHH